MTGRSTRREFAKRRRAVSRCTALRRALPAVPLLACAAWLTQPAQAQISEMTIIAGSTLAVTCQQPNTLTGPICNGGYSGDGGYAVNAQFENPAGVAVAPNGNYYIADGLNARIRVVYANNGAINTYAIIPGQSTGATATAVATDAAGNIFYGDNNGNVYMNGTGLSNTDSFSVEALAPDNNGNLYVLSSVQFEYYRLYIVNVKTGAATLLLDTTTTAGINNDNLYGLATDGAGDVYIIDPAWHGLSNSVTGTPVILDFYVTNTGGTYSVSSTTPALVFFTLYAAYGQSLAFEPSTGAFYIDEGSAVIKYTPGSTVVPPVAGTGTDGYNSGYDVDNVAEPATQTEINTVGGISLTPAGALYIADTDNNVIRRVTDSPGCQECGPTTLTQTDQFPLLSLDYAVNPVTNKLYLSDPASSVVNVYNLSNDSLITSVPVGSSPGQPAVDSVNNVVYVPNTGSSSVTVITGVTDTVAATIPMTLASPGFTPSTTPLTIAVDPTLNKAYVALNNGGFINVIQGPTAANGNAAWAQGASIPVFIPSALAVDTKNNIVYARCFCAEGSGTPLGEEQYSMAVIDANTDTVTSTQLEFVGQSTDIATDSIAVDETSGNVVIADSEEPTLHIWQPATGGFEQITPSFYPEHVAVDSYNEVAYFTDGYGNSGSYNLTTGQNLTLTQNPNVEATCGAASSAIGLDPTTDQAYITVCPETVADPNCTTTMCAGLDLFDGPTGKLLAQLPLGDPSNSDNSLFGNFAVAVNPSTHAVYVGDSVTSTIDVVNGPSGSLLAQRPLLVFSPSPLTLPAVAAGDTTSATLTVTNCGTQSATLAPTLSASQSLGMGLITPATCTAAAPTTPSTTCPPATPVPGTSCSFDVQFAPNPGISGSYNGSIMFSDQALNAPQIIPFTGTVGLTSVVFSPAAVDFGTIPYDSGTTIPVTVTNVGSSNLIVSSTQFVQEGSTNYSADFEQYSNCLGSTGIAPNASCTITVSYYPVSFPAGSTELVYLQVTDNAGTGTQTLDVSGSSGSASLGFAVFSSGNTSNAENLSVNFGDIEYSAPSATAKITVENEGGGALTFNSIDITSGDFQILSNTCPTAPSSLAAYGSCVLGVFFTPTEAPGSVESAQIVFNESNSTVSSQSISLSGTSSAPLGPPSLPLSSTSPLLVSSDNSVPPNPAASSAGGTIAPAPYAAVSSGGQFVAFSYSATNLPGPLQAEPNSPLSGVYLRNTCVGADPNCDQNTNFVAYGPTAGPASNGGGACGGSSTSGTGSTYPAIDNTGEFVAFLSGQCNFNGSTSSNVTQIFLHDVIHGTTNLVSANAAGNPVSLGAAQNPFSMSSNGQAFAYETASPEVVTGTTFPSGGFDAPGANNPYEVYWSNCAQQSNGVCASSPILISQDTTNSNVAANNTAEDPAISANGRYVAFASLATNLVSATIPSGSEQVFLRDTVTSTTTLISAGATTESASSTNPSVSGDGRFVAYESDDPSLAVAAGLPSTSDTQIYLRDTCLSNGANVCGSGSPSTTLLSQFNGKTATESTNSPFISADGRLVTFTSASASLNEMNFSSLGTYEYDTCIANEAPVPSCTPALYLLYSLSTTAFGGGELPTAPVDATDQFAVFNITTLSEGIYPVAQAYLGPTTVTASSIPTSTTLKLSGSSLLTPTSVIYGQPVTLTATVSLSSGGTLMTGGSVNFFDGSVFLGTATPNTQGLAVLTTPNIAPGPQLLSAVFSPSGLYGPSSGLASLDVLTLIELQVSPSTATIGAEATQQFSVTGTFSNGEVYPIPGTISWSATPASVASIDSSGLATGLTAGTATITASQGSISGTATLTVTTVGPAPPINVPPNGDTENITVTDTDTVSAYTLPAAINVDVPVAYYSVGTPLGFGSQNGSQQIVAVANAGQAPMTLSSVAVNAGAPFSIAAFQCLNGSTTTGSDSATLPSGGFCTVTITYSGTSPATDTGTLTFTDNADLSNLLSTASGSNYTQSITLNGTGGVTAPPALPPATISVPPNGDSEQITVTDTASVYAGYLIGGTVTGLNAGTSVTLLDNGTDSVAIGSNGAFTFPIPIATGSAYAVTVSAQPANQMCTVASGAGTVAAANITNVSVVCKTQTLTTLSISPSPASGGQQVSFTATVAPLAGTGTPTGSVTFSCVNGPAGQPVTSGAVSLVSGVAVWNTTALASFDYSNCFNAAYSGDNNFLPSTSTSESLEVSDFQINFPTPSHLNLLPGQSTQLPLTVSQANGAFNGTVSFAMTGLPPSVTANFDPATVTLTGGSGSVTAMVTLTAAQLNAQQAPASGSRSIRTLILAVLLPLFAPLAGLGRVRRRLRRHGRLVLLMLLCFGALLDLSSCGSSSGFFNQPPQTYTVTLTATSGTDVHSTSFSLTVE